MFFKKSFFGMVFITVFLVLLLNYGCSGCGDGCKDCAGITQTCLVCRNGYWIHGRICERCPDNCEQCSNYTHCLRCEAGFYSTLCLLNCTLCKDGLCDIENGRCLNGCTDGYYMYEDITHQTQTCQKCSSNCTLCESQGTCSECDTGFYIFRYESKPNNVIATCSYCLPVCEECNYTSSNCTVCKPGTYGQLCQYSCSESHCYRCDEADGVEKCTECASGYMLDRGSCISEINCSQNCAYGCDESELCIGGCNDGWSGQTCTNKCVSQCQKCQQDNNSLCTKCKENFFGSSCNIACNEHCSQNVLDETYRLHDGFCVTGCTGGHWGDTCNETCNQGCNSIRCNLTNGYCATCHRNYYGPACRHYCSEHCADNDSSTLICEKRDGKCILGCEDGYVGDRCEEAVTTQKSVTEKSDAHPEKPDCNDTQFYLFGILTGVGISLVVVVAGTGLFCFLRRRQKLTSKTADTRASTEEKEYENTAMGIMTLRSADTEYYNESKGYDKTPVETSLNVYERLQDNKQDDQQQYTELGRPEQK